MVYGQGRINGVMVCKASVAADCLSHFAVPRIILNSSVDDDVLILHVHPYRLE